MDDKFDVFISHASADKAGFVRPLAETLRGLGVTVWYDEFSLELGDSISSGIAKGIANSRFGIVVISQAFIQRPWTRHELRGLTGLDVEEQLRIIPIWHGVDREQVARLDPSLADKLALNTATTSAQDAALAILRIVRPDIYGRHPRSELERLASGEAVQRLQDEIESLNAKLAQYSCPACGSGMSGRIDAPVDDSHDHWDVRETFDCGSMYFGGRVERPCGRHPEFPPFEDYEILTVPHREHGVLVLAKPKTDKARRLRLPEVWAPDASSATGAMRNQYDRIAGR